MDQFKLMTNEDRINTRDNFNNFMFNDYYAIMMLVNGDILLINDKVKADFPEFYNLIGINL